MFKKIYIACLHLLFPTYCCQCRAFGPYLCDACFSELHFFPLPSHLTLNPLWIDSAQALCAHTPPITRVLYQFKYDGAKDIGEYLGKLLYHSAAFPKVDYITAVPLHPKKMFWRGFNQAECIARPFAAAAQIPYRPLLYRDHASAAQAKGMNKEERMKNTANLYGLLRTAPHLKSQRILIIDDVLTTGTTLNACAGVLKSAGAIWVGGLTISGRR